MKTILKNCATGLYYQGVADWTEQLDMAFDFQRPERLIKFIRATELNPNDLELVFAFEDPRYNLSLAIDERFGVKRGRKNNVRRLHIMPALAKQPILTTTRKGRGACREYLGGMHPRSS
jgi:hypothetical protein